jgi:cytochrome c-type biogenesis protein CcmH/NrfG
MAQKETADPETRLALLRTDDGKPVDALLRSLQERAQRHPDKLDTWVLLGHAWVRKARETAEPGYYRNAEACATVALRLEPQSALAVNLRGLVLLNDHRFREALQLAQSILQRRDFDPQALGTVSDALLELGRIDGAEAQPAVVCTRVVSALSPRP